MTEPARFAHGTTRGDRASSGAAQDARRRGLLVEYRLLMVVVLMVIGAGTLSVTTRLAERFSSLGGALLP